MKVSAAKENILKKIRQALSNQVPVPFPESEGTESVFDIPKQELAVTFAEKFSVLMGRFSYCLDETEFAEQLKSLVTAKQLNNMYCRETELKVLLQNKGIATTATDVKTCQASITSCEKLIARTGSIVMSSGQQSGRTVSVYAPIHICVAYTDQLVADIKDALIDIKTSYPSLPSMITLATGPSRTADIEKTLIVGVHGPKEVFCFLIER